ncbi:RHS repeat-associated core domain-containing protein [Nonomuraea sp. NPDC050328]|uniref:RHS repeat-associated core domain-containing protein n=1 Tax=Nonomuraea sp. NPDC050328 TaxID=3364361 RepID=UPI003798218A
MASADSLPTVAEIGSSGQLSSGLWTYSSLTPTFSGQVSDSAGRYVALGVQVEHDPSAAGQGSGLIWSGESDSPGTGANWDVTSPAVSSGKLQDGWLIRWRVRALASNFSDMRSPVVGGAWSEWQAGRIDTTKPTVSLVSSSGQLSSGLWTFSSLTPTFSGQVSDSAGRYVALGVQVEHDPSAAGQGSGLIWSGESDSPGTGANWDVTSPAVSSGKLQDGWLIRWRVRALASNFSDMRSPVVGGAWSEWQAGRIDTTKPTVSLVSSSGQLSSGLWTFSSLTPTFSGRVSDPAGRYVALGVQVEHDPSAAGQGSGLIWSGESDSPGTGANWDVTSPAVSSGKLQDGWLIRWRVRALASNFSDMRSPVVGGAWSEWRTGKIEINKPAGSGLGALPATQSAGQWVLSSLRPQFFMKVTAANGAASFLEAAIEYDPVAGQGTGAIWSGKGTISYASGANAWLTVPAGVLADGYQIRWRLRGVTTGGVAGTWSDWQLSRIDLKKPAVAVPGLTPGTAASESWTVSSITPWVYAQVTDPENRPSLLSVEIQHDPANPAQGTGLIYSGTGTQSVNAGATAWARVPSGKLQDGWHILWRVQGKTGSGVAGPWTNWRAARIDLTKPSVEGLGMDPAARGTASWTATALTPWLYAKVSDPENRQMKLEAQVEHDPVMAEQGTGPIWTGVSSSAYASGTNAWLVVPSGRLSDGWLVRWRVRPVTTSGVSGAWSDWVSAKISALPFQTFAPANNGQVGTLTPVLSANARPATEAAVKYWFQVCEGTSPNWTWCASSPDWTAAGAWQVPANKLTWGKTYSWMAKAATTYTTVTSAWRTFTPTPDQGGINALAGGAQGKEFNQVSGNYAHTATDASVTVAGPPLSVTRTYNSLDSRTDGLFGAGWSTRWDMRIEPEPGGNVLITYPNGQQLRFAAKSDGSFAAPSGIFATLAAEPAGGWRLMDKSATSYWFNAAGALVKIADRRGRAQEMVRGSDGRLAKVTAVGGRSLTFTWTGNHITSVSTDPVNGAPMTWTYTYDGDQLAKVCPPESATACTTYAYTAASRYKSAVINSAPGFYYRLNESSTQTGTIVSSSAGWNITEEQAKLTGTTPADLGTGVQGALGGSPDTAMRFKGAATSTFVQLPRSTISGQGGQLAVEAWFKTTASGTVIGMQNSADNTPSAFTPVVYVGTDGKLRAQFYTGAHAPITSPAVVNDGTWHHVVLSAVSSKAPTSTTPGESTQTLYLDGVALGTLAGEIKHGDQWETRIGSGYASTAWPASTTTTKAFPFNGDIDEVAVYGKPLSAQVVQQHFAARVAQPQLTKITLPSGRTQAANTYAADGGRLATYTDANGGTWKLSDVAYAKQTTISTFATITVTDPGAGTITYVTDASRGYREVSTTDQLGQQTKYAYDIGGSAAKVYDANNNVVEMAYDARGNLLAKKSCRTATSCSSDYFSYYVNADDPFDPRNDVTIGHRDGRSSSATDETYLTAWAYNSFGEQTKETTPATSDFPNGRSTSTTYTDGTEAAVGGGLVPAGLLKSKTDQLGNTWTYEHNAAGDLVQQTSPTGVITKIEYDTLGRTTRTTLISDAYPDGVSTTSTYDTAGRLATQTGQGVKNEISGVTHTSRVEYTYDADGRKLTETFSDTTGGDPSRTTTTTYDAAGRVETVTGPAGGVLRQQWNTLGQLVRVTDERGTVIENAYSTRGDLVTRTLKGWTGSPVNPQPAADVVLEARSYDPVGRLATQVDAMGRKTSYTYFADNMVATKIADDVRLNGSTTARDVVLESYTYDAARNPTKVVTGGGRLGAVFTYDAASRIVSQTVDPDGLKRTTTVSYNAAGSPLKVTLSGGGSSRIETREYRYTATGELEREIANTGDDDLITSMTYDDRGLTASVTDPRGNLPGANAAAYTTTMRYDGASRLVEITQPPVQVDKVEYSTMARPITRRGYDSAGRQTHETNAEGQTTISTFDKAGRLTGVVLPSYTPPGGTPITPTATSTYDVAGQLVRSTDPRGFSRAFEYDGLGRLVRTTDPAATGQAAGQWIKEYDLLGEQLAAVDPLGARVEATYDDLGRPITQTVIERHPSTAAFTTRMEYNDAGQVVKTVQPDGKVTTLDVNAIGEVVSVTDPLSNKTTTDYDQAGRVVKSVDPLGNAQISEYDLAGRKIVVKDTDKTGTVLRTASVGYDAVGNPIAAISPEGYITKQTYDALNRPMSLIEPITADTSITTTFGYDATGARTRLTDGRGNTTWTTYNSLGLAESLIEPATTAHPSLADRTWTATYDAGGLPVVSQQPGGVRIERVFDHLGRLTKENGAGGTATSAGRTFSYDLAGRPTSLGDLAASYNDRGLLTQVARDAAAQSIFAYDSLGRLTQRTDKAGSASFTYDDASRLKTATDPITGRTLSYDYDEASRLTSLIGKNSSGATADSQTFEYDGLGRLTSQTMKNAAGALMASITYEWDKNNQLRNKTTVGVAGAGANSYTYDLAGRLASWTAPSGAVTTYKWDNAGNRTKAGDQEFVYDERNHLIRSNSSGTQTGTTYSYTARGTLASQITEGKVTTATFDAFDRLVADSDSLYTYDALDRVSTRITGPAKQLFAYTGISNDLAAITVADATSPSARYGRGPTGTLLGLQEGTEPAVGSLSDLHGDLVATFNSTGFVSSTGFGPFGEVLAQSGNKNSLGYQGQYTDPDTGKVNMHARWYQPEIGTFASRDSATLEPNPSVQANRFTYANASPMTGIDPTGHNTVACYGNCDSGGSLTWIPSGGTGYATSSASASAPYNDCNYAVCIGGSGSSDGSRPVGCNVCGDYLLVLTKAEMKMLDQLPNGMHPPASFWTLSAKAQDGIIEKIYKGVLSEDDIIALITFAHYLQQKKKMEDFKKGLNYKLSGPVDEKLTACQKKLGMKECAKMLEATAKMIEAKTYFEDCAGGTNSFRRFLDVAGNWVSGDCQKLFKSLGLSVVDAGKLEVERFLSDVRSWITGYVNGVVSDLARCGFDDMGSCLLFGSNFFAGSRLMRGLDDIAGSMPKLKDAIIAAKVVCDNSFVAGTQVLMADGTRKEIENIEPGDVVSAADPVVDKAGAKVVTSARMAKGRAALVYIKVRSADNPRSSATIVATEGHPFWVEDTRSWIPAGALLPGYDLTTDDGPYLTVTSVKKRAASDKFVYNFSVDDYNSYHVATEIGAVLVHNSAPCIRVSVAFQDWATKGAHVHVGKYEVRVFPNEKGGVGVKGVRIKTGMPGRAELDFVLKSLQRDSALRENLIRNARDAMDRMNSGKLGMAKNRALEMHFLIKALEKMNG